MTRKKLAWTNEKRKLSDLIPWEQNPRQIRESEAKRLADSYVEFSQVETIAIGPENEIYNGHQRLYTWADKFGPDLEVDVRVSNRKLTTKERQKLTVFLHEGAVGEWDFDTLANWDVELEELKEWGLESLDFALDSKDDNYSRKIEAPTYTPSGEKPIISSLFDDSKTRKLIDDIDSLEGITEEEWVFLRIAAQRHTVLNFKLIADYYAHSDEKMQSLMEDSALVIIDFDKAISQGYVELTKEIAEMVRDEYGDD